MSPETRSHYNIRPSRLAKEGVSKQQTHPSLAWLAGNMLTPSRLVRRTAKASLALIAVSAPGEKPRMANSQTPGHYHRRRRHHLPHVLQGRPKPPPAAQDFVCGLPDTESAQQPPAAVSGRTTLPLGGSGFLAQLAHQVAMNRGGGLTAGAHGLYDRRRTGNDVSTSVDAR